jgi:hypothetical protein
MTARLVCAANPSGLDNNNPPASKPVMRLKFMRQAYRHRPGFTTKKPVPVEEVSAFSSEADMFAQSKFWPLSSPGRAKH